MCFAIPPHPPGEARIREGVDIIRRVLAIFFKNAKKIKASITIFLVLSFARGVRGEFTIPVIIMSTAGTNFSPVTGVPLVGVIFFVHGPCHILIFISERRNGAAAALR